MKPVFQTEEIHSPVHGLFGDCTRACVASILELPMTEVPNFADTGRFSDYNQAIREFLASRNLSLMTVVVPVAGLEQARNSLEKNGVEQYHLIGGIQGASKHNTVGQYGVVVHNPSRRSGALGVLLPDPEVGGFEFGFFLPRSLT